MKLARILLFAATLIAAHFSTAASAQQPPVYAEVTFGEVLVRAAASKLLENKTQALTIFNKREEGNFRYGDWYVFCYRAETGAMEGGSEGSNIMDYRDPYDRLVGPLIFEASPKQDHKIESVTYMAYGRHLQNRSHFGKTWLIRVSDLVCGVGDYFLAVT
jgi:hypothetical protein